jgi:predicted NBD/HSP70 family sugar kinase
MASSAESSYAIGVDLGGTKTEASLVDAAGRIAETQRVPPNQNGVALAIGENRATLPARADRLPQAVLQDPGGSRPPTAPPGATFDS